CATGIEFCFPALLDGPSRTNKTASTTTSLGIGVRHLSRRSAHVRQKSLELCSASSCVHQGGCELRVPPVCCPTTNVSLFSFGRSDAGAAAARQLAGPAGVT
ncbi:unnamed protein product, partial [Ixodes pacificus]